MEKPLSEEIVDSILDGNKESFMAAFQAAIAAKVSDALEVKKIEIASTLITPEVAVEEEVDLDESKGKMDDEDEDSEDMKEEVEQVEEAFRLFHPGKKAIIKNIDKHGFTGRENHPPTDGSLNGHTIRITDYGDATGKHGVTSGLGGPRYQAVLGKVLTGKHKGKEFEFIQHELQHVKEKEQTNEAIRVVDRWYPGVPMDRRKRQDVANTVRRIRQHPNARGGMTGFNKYQDFFGGHNVRLGAEREETVTIKEDLGSAYEEIMASHHSARQKGRDALAAGNHAAAENHFVSAGLHLSKAEEVAKDYFKFHGVELHKPNHPRYSPYITGNWDKVT